MKIGSQKGDSIVGIPIITAVVFLMLIIFIINFIGMIEPFVIYEKISSTSLKYIFIMEEYGFLTNQEKQGLIEELINKGLDPIQVTVTGTSVLKNYGEPISLKITYNHPMRFPQFEDSIMPSFNEKTLKINVEKRSFSKR